MPNGTMIHQVRPSTPRDLGVFLNPEVVDPTISAEEERERFEGRRARFEAREMGVIKGLGISPTGILPGLRLRPGVGVPIAAVVGIGAVSTAISGLGAWASFRAISKEKSTFWDIVHGFIGLGFGFNALLSLIGTIGIVFGLSSIEAPTPPTPAEGSGGFVGPLPTF